MYIIVEIGFKPHLHTSTLKYHVYIDKPVILDKPDVLEVPEFPYKQTFMKDPMYYFNNLRTKSYLVSNEFILVNDATFGDNQWKYDN